MGERMGADSQVKCCLCREPVIASGWCENCQRWPVNITPIRFCEHGHAVTWDGFCQGCMDYVATRLDAVAGEWVDTRQVSHLYGREENQRRWGFLVRDLELRQLAGRTPKPVEQQKRELREWEQHREEVPF